MLPNNLVATRQTEARASVRTLGIDTENVQFLHLPNGRLSHLSEGEISDAVMRLASVLTAIAPTMLFTPYRHDGSSEHEAAYRLLQASLTHSKLTPRLLEFPVWSWWSPVLLFRCLLRIRRVLRVFINQYAATKADAIACHRSQIEPVDPWTQPVLSSAFVRCFLISEEFFFEI
jgi:LmbE family N-acetylglucosaminyl deacetylase